MTLDNQEGKKIDHVSFDKDGDIVYSLNRDDDEYAVQWWKSEGRWVSRCCEYGDISRKWSIEQFDENDYHAILHVYGLKENNISLQKAETMSPNKLQALAKNIK